MAEKKTAKKAVRAEGSSKEGRVRVQKFGHGKKYNEVVKSVDKSRAYALAEALELVKATSPVKFDATVELHMRMGLDPKKPEQNIRSTVTLPAGSGRVPKILVLAEDGDTEKAKKAGADHAGLDELIEKIAGGWFDFDMVIATPAAMPKVGKLGQTLGTKGLMPNPKSGTVTADVEKAVSEFKKGKVEFRLDKDAIIHMGIGKVSFGVADLEQNFNAVFSAIRGAKPSSAKGTYIKSVSLSSTMGPGVKLDISTIN